MSNALFERLQKEEWSVVSVERSADDTATNERATDSLHALLIALASDVEAYDVVGRYQGSVERSVLILGPRAHGIARAIGNIARQESILTEQGLEYLASGSLYPSAGIRETESANNASTLTLPNGESFTFTSDIYWDVEVSL